MKTKRHRDRLLRVWLTEGEEAALDALVGDADKSDWVRRRLLDDQVEEDGRVLRRIRREQAEEDGK